MGEKRLPETVYDLIAKTRLTWRRSLRHRQSSLGPGGSLPQPIFVCYYLRTILLLGTFCKIVSYCQRAIGNSRRGALCCVSVQTRRHHGHSVFLKTKVCLDSFPDETAVLGTSCHYWPLNSPGMLYVCLLYRDSLCDIQTTSDSFPHDSFGLCGYTTKLQVIILVLTQDITVTYYGTTRRLC
jgi:hypothetical protein